MRPCLNQFDINNFTTRLVHASNFLGNAVHAQAGVANARSELIHCSFILTTDATVATRYPRIDFDDPSYASPLMASYQGAVASNAWTYVFSQNIQNTQVAGTRRYHHALPTGVYLLENWFHRITIENGVVGDVVSAVRFYYKIWPFEQ